MTEVIIDTAGPTITVRSSDDLDKVRAVAMDLFRETLALCPMPKQSETAIGFANNERSDTSTLYTYDAPY